ncbi:MAG: GSCFA domain-containing protein [Chitinophagaceae bacterium]|nr:GSCFA domain-containing protein [Chitinophagaceae bacterium]
MQFQLPIHIPPFEPRIEHHEGIMLMGSCFTEQMGQYLEKSGFRVLQNSHGILFNPLSLARALRDVLQQRQYTASDLFFLNEYWHSWYHHSDFSFRNPKDTLHAINTAITRFHEALSKTSVLIITLGSAFAYRHREEGIYVSNNHRAPHQWFEKELLSANTIQTELQLIIDQLQKAYPALRVLCTISPVRHIRDGVIDNNRSKARLIEAVHNLQNTYYFPAYELVMDILRDYRFFDVDMVHPNYTATRFVWEHFRDTCIKPEALPLMEAMEQLHKARTHKPKDTQSLAHQRFLQQQAEQCRVLQQQYPYLALQEFMAYFSNTTD